MSPTVLILFCFLTTSTAQDKPNIIFILADDLGFNDIGYNNPEVITNNINDLATNGVILDRNYVQPVCTPSRTALLSGTYPYKIGMQVSILTCLICYGFYYKIIQRDLQLETMNPKEYLWIKLCFLNFYNHKATKLIKLESKRALGEIFCLISKYCDFFTDGMLDFAKKIICLKVEDFIQLLDTGVVEL